MRGLESLERRLCSLEASTGEHSGLGWSRDGKRYHGSDAKQWYEAYRNLRADYWQFLAAWEEFDALEPPGVCRLDEKTRIAYERLIEAAALAKVSR